MRTVRDQARVDADLALARVLQGLSSRVRRARREPTFLSHAVQSSPSSEADEATLRSVHSAGSSCWPAWTQYRESVNSNASCALISRVATGGPDERD